MTGEHANHYTTEKCNKRELKLHVKLNTKNPDYQFNFQLIFTNQSCEGGCH